MSNDWKKEARWATILYRALECDEEFDIVCTGTGHEFIEADLLEMRREGYLRDEGALLVPTQKAKTFRKKLAAMLDQLSNFEIFAEVDVSVALTEEDGAPDEEDGPTLQVFDHVYDPRFRPTEDAEDMRLAMMAFLSKSFADAPKPTDFQGNVLLDPHRVVFLQMVAEGDLSVDPFWQDLRMGRFFDKVDEIVSSAYQWTDVTSDPEEAETIMREIWTAGQLELQKRKGEECGKCGIPLAVIETAAKEEGVEFYTKCPEGGDCAWHPDNYVPAGTALDAGGGEDETITTTTTEEGSSEEVVDDYDDIEPYGFYDPYDPFVDMLAFAIVCDVMF